MLFVRLPAIRNRMEQRGARYAVQTMCEAGGLANATLLERL
jgi:acetyl-CoA acyltransferase